MKSLRTLMQQIEAQPILDGDAVIQDLRTDSREVKPGTLFLARVGAQADGHRYLKTAVERGAAAVLVTRPDTVPKDLGVPAYAVAAQDPTYGLLAAEFFDHPTHHLQVYGVTGTNGKSSTAWMLDHLLRSIGRKPALISTLMYKVGDQCFEAPNTTPDAVVIQRLARAAVDAQCSDLVMEVSSHGVATGRISGVRFRVGGFTNFSRDHLDFHGSEAAYLRAKALFFTLFLRQQDAPADAVIIDGPKREELMELLQGLPVFDASLDYLRVLTRFDAPSSHTTVVSFDVDTPQDVHIERSSPATLDGTAIALKEGQNTWDGFVPIAGSFQVENAALAMTMVQRVEAIPWEKLLEAMRSFSGVPGRLERIAEPRADEPSIFVDYAHTPDAITAVLKTARALTPHTLSIVVGCGGDRDRGKRPLMARAALEYADVSVFTTDNPRHENPEAILDDMCADLSADATIERITDRRKAIAYGIEHARNGVCVIAGKGHEEYQDVQGEQWLWRDTDEARAYIAQQRYAHPEPMRLSGWSPEHLAQILVGQWNGTPPRLIFGGLSTDTRTIQQGDIFVALKGPRFDAHDHLQKAFDQGASAAIVERFVEGVCAPQLLVQSPYDALGAIAKSLIQEARRAQTGLQIIGITGSNGKTTTRTFAAALLALRHGRAPLATRGNFNNQIGLPLSVAPLSMLQQHAVLEMGANQPGDIEDLVTMAPPDVAVLTSIAPSHLDGFGSVDGIRRAKAEMIRYGRPRVVVMPYQESLSVWGEDARAIGARILTFGTEEGASIRAVRERATGPVHIQGQHVWRDVDFHIDLPIPGRHNAGNFAAALLATSIVDGILVSPPSVERLKQFEEHFSPEPGRLEMYECAGRSVIFDAYNANPGSARAALDVLQEFGHPRVAVLGELLELGGEEATLHHAVLEDAAARCDVVITIGDRWPSSEYTHVHHCLERKHAVALVVEYAPKHSTLLWKGSRGARLELARDEVESIWNHQE